MKVYIVRHYWDESSYGTKLKPDWIVSGSYNLTEEQKKVKTLVLNKLIKPVNYSRFVREKTKEEFIDNFYVYFCYKTKPDPYPGNNRMVTDITFFISPKKLKYKDLCNLEIPENYELEIKNVDYRKHITFTFIFSILILVTFFILTNKNKDIDNNNRQVVSTKDNNKIKKENTVYMEGKKTKVANINVKEKLYNSHRKKLCNNEFIINLSKDEKCYSEYIKDMCNPNTNLDISYLEWTEKKENISKNPICYLVNQKKNDEDLKSIYVKVSSDKKKIIETFFKRRFE